MGAKINRIGGIPLAKEQEIMEEGILFKANKGKSTLIVFSKETSIDFEGEIRFKVANQLKVDERQVIMYGGIENLHEKAHMDMLVKKIKENTIVNKIVVATATKGKYNKDYLDRYFDYICPVQISKLKKKDNE